MNNNFLPYQLKKNAEQNSALAASLAQITNHNPSTESVIFYGADTTQTNDSTQAFLNAMQNYEIVIVPTGNYLINSSITILSSYKVKKIIGTGGMSSLLHFNGTDGIINQKSGVIIEGIGLTGNSSNKVGSGIKLQAPIQMKNCLVSTFNIGIDLTQQVNIITSFFEKVTISYNASYGVQITSGGQYQNNAITFKECYINKNGTSADNLIANATIGTGDGMYINGGYAILVQDCVFEYNTGVGLRLSCSGYPLYGVMVSAPYFERNKYANLYIDNTSGSNYMLGISIFGDFYTDAGIAQVANALTNRQMYIVKPNALLNSQGSNFFGQYSFAERNMKTRRSNLLNAFPINRMDDLSIDYPNNITTYNTDTVFQITNSINGVTFNSELMHVDPTYDYIFSYDVIKTSTTTSPNLLSYLYDNDSNALINSAATYLGGQENTLRLRG